MYIQQSQNCFIILKFRLSSALKVRSDVIKSAFLYDFRADFLTVILTDVTTVTEKSYADSSSACMMSGHSGLSLLSLRRMFDARCVNEVQSVKILVQSNKKKVTNMANMPG